MVKKRGVVKTKKVSRKTISRKVKNKNSIKKKTPRASGINKFEKEFEEEFKKEFIETKKWMIQRRKFFLKLGITIIFVIILILILTLLGSIMGWVVF